MMARYIRRQPRGHVRHWAEDELWDNQSPMMPSLTVDDHEAVDTGLLWQDGSAVYRAPSPMGFGRDDEWDGS